MLGKPAPDFSLPCTGGSSAFRLSEQRARTLWRYFYPEDHTPGGTTKGADFRDRHSEFKREIYGVSRDALNSRAAFKAKMKFPFDLLSDPAERACAQFGVMKDKNLYGKKVRDIERSAFVSDEKGKLAHDWRGVKVPGHVEEVLSFVKAL